MEKKLFEIDNVPFYESNKKPPLSKCECNYCKSSNLERIRDVKVIYVGGLMYKDIVFKCDECGKETIKTLMIC